METEKLRTHIENIIKNTFETIDKVYCNNREDETGTPCNSSNLIFPKYTSDGNRVSEQELRCIFIEEFNKSSNGYFYSIETPTQMRYSFSRESRNVIPQSYPKEKGKGRSGCIDLAIFNKDKKRCAIIEFKKAPCDSHEYAKDFLKLFSEPGDEILRFFICISEGSSNGKAPISHLRSKEDNRKENINNEKDGKMYSFFSYNSYNDPDAIETNKNHSLYFYSHKLCDSKEDEYAIICFEKTENNIKIQ